MRAYWRDTKLLAREQQLIEARDQAMKGRRYVEENWRREKAFGDLKQVLEQAANGHAGSV